VAEVCGADIEYRRMDVYQVEQLGRRFDLVLCLGVLYHLRHPLLALDLLREHAVGDTLVFQSLMRGSRDVPALASDYPFSETAVFDDRAYPAMFFVEKSYSHDPTNWWIPNRACAEAMLRSAGFEITDHPEEEVYICKRGKSHG
jgi:tRNA (mo5U34)-methyltransferase